MIKITKLKPVFDSSTVRLILKGVRLSFLYYQKHGLPEKLMSDISILDTNIPELKDGLKHSPCEITWGYIPLGNFDILEDCINRGLNLSPKAMTCYKEIVLAITVMSFLESGIECFNYLIESNYEENYTIWEFSNRK